MIRPDYSTKLLVYELISGQSSGSVLCAHNKWLSLNTVVTIPKKGGAWTITGIRNPRDSNGDSDLQDLEYEKLKLLK